MSYEKVIRELKNKVYYPIYFLSGEEPYYIDLISDYIEKNVLAESEKEFNQTILYGKDIDALTLISYAKRYPMMSNYQVIIVKEAQEIRGLTGKEDKKKDKKEDRIPFLEYSLNPQKTTLLVLCYKKKIDGRLKVFKELQKHGILFESKRLYDNQVPEWINSYVLSKGYRINPKASMVTAEYLGTDLSKIANEIDKLLLNIPAGNEITLEQVENNIGISKDFNIFELNSALARRNVLKANMIINYFAENQKSNHITMTLGQLYSYFMKVLTYHKLPIRSKDQVAGALGVNPYFVYEYEAAAKAYPEHKVLNIISDIRDYDMRSKGVNVGNNEPGALLKELMYKILH